MILCPVKDRSRFLQPRVSQWFGANYDVYKQFGSKNGHSGIDFAIAVGTPLYAPFDGVVTLNKTHKNYGYNIRVKNDRLEAILAHLSSFAVEDGQEVGAGELLGFSGGQKGHPGAGFSSGPHLHFSVRHISEDGKATYPENGNFGWEDLSPYMITWHRTLR